MANPKETDKLSKNVRDDDEMIFRAESRESKSPRGSSLELYGTHCILRVFKKEEKWGLKPVIHILLLHTNKTNDNSKKPLKQ